MINIRTAAESRIMECFEDRYNNYEEHNENIKLIAQVLVDRVEDSIKNIINKFMKNLDEKKDKNGTIKELVSDLADSLATPYYPHNIFKEKTIEEKGKKRTIRIYYYPPHITEKKCSNWVRIGICQLYLNNPKKKLFDSNGKIFRICDEKNGKILNSIWKCLDLICKKQINLFCFPEYISSEKIDKKISKWLKNREEVVIGGSYISKSKKNICPVYIDGRVFYTEKIFKSPLQKNSMKNKKEIKGGNILWHFDTRYGKFMVIICNDIMFSGIMSCVLSEEIDFLFNPMANRSPSDYIKEANQLLVKNKGPNSFFIIQPNSLISEKYKGDGHSTILGRVSKDWINFNRIYDEKLDFVLEQLNKEEISIVRLNKKYKDTTRKDYSFDPNIEYEDRIPLEDR